MFTLYMRLYSNIHVTVPNLIMIANCNIHTFDYVSHRGRLLYNYTDVFQARIEKSGI